jgi:PKHD-type hydroxylase
MPEMYRDLYKFIVKANENHFGFGDIQITENAQFTEYPEGGFYDWHMDCDVSMEHEPPVRKISMTLLLNDPSEFEGGELEVTAPGKYAPLKQGHAICFASFLTHRVNVVKRGMRQSLVVWFGGKPFR